MEERNVQIRIKNVAGTDWDRLFPLTKLENVLDAEGKTAEERLNAVEAGAQSTEERVAAVEEKSEAAFTAGNERKEEVVAALIAMGIEATTEETWVELIGKIKATGDAVPGDVRAGKTFSTPEGSQVGTLPEQATTVITPGGIPLNFSAGIYKAFSVAASNLKTQTISRNIPVSSFVDIPVTGFETYISGFVYRNSNTSNKTGLFVFPGESIGIHSASLGGTNNELSIGFVSLDKKAVRVNNTSTVSSAIANGTLFGL